LFGAAIVGGTPAAPSIEDGWRALELCNALLVSAREGRCVRINQTS
jgi:predicted dehydrogenase